MTPESPAPVRRKMFVKASTVPKLSPERLKRQSMITHLAFSLFGDSAEAVRFLNQIDTALGGRPLDVATASAAGYTAVENAIRLLAEPDAERGQ